MTPYPRQYRHNHEGRERNADIQWVSAFLESSTHSHVLSRYAVPNRGNTKSQSSHSEASSYHHLSLVTNLVSSSFARVTTEEDALDSFQNLLFSIARFHEYTGRYPSRITVVGYEMKRKRFEELHRVAIRWPSDRFHYIGIDAEAQDIERAREGEVRIYSLNFTSRDRHSNWLNLFLVRNTMDTSHTRKISTGAMMLSFPNDVHAIRTFGTTHISHLLLNSVPYSTGVRQL